MDHLLSKEKGRRQKSLQAKNRRRRNLGKKRKKRYSKLLCLVLKDRIFQKENPRGPIAQLVRAHA